MDYIYDFEKIIKEVTRIAGHEIDISKIEIIDRGIPHIPKSLKTGTMGVYTFLYNDKFLKIGTAGPNSNARFLSQHYTGSAMSTLSGSILADPDMEKFRLTKDNVGQWIKNNCRRIDILLDVEVGIFTLELIEATLHYRYEPKYEGFASQR